METPVDIFWSVFWFRCDISEFICKRILFNFRDLMYNREHMKNGNMCCHLLQKLGVVRHEIWSWILGWVKHGSMLVLMKLFWNSKFCRFNIIMGFVGIMQMKNRCSTSFFYHFNTAQKVRWDQNLGFTKKVSLETVAILMCVWIYRRLTVSTKLARINKKPLCDRLSLSKCFFHGYDINT